MTTTVENIINETCYVIYDISKKTFLDKDDFFTSHLKNAKLFSNAFDAADTLKYYIKIYKNTNRNDTTLNLKILLVKMETIDM